MNICKYIFLIKKNVRVRVIGGYNHFQQYISNIAYLCLFNLYIPKHLSIPNTKVGPKDLDRFHCCRDNLKWPYYKRGSLS